MPGGSFVNGQVPTLAQVNAWLTSVATADIAAGAVTYDKLANLPAVRVTNNANISIPNAGGGLTLTFNTEAEVQTFDTHAMHSITANTDRLVAPGSGKYLVIAQVVYAANATGVRQLYLYVNGAATPAGVSSALANPVTNTTPITLSTTVGLNANDYVTVLAYQDSGGALNVLFQNDFSPCFMMVRVA